MKKLSIAVLIFVGLFFLSALWLFSQIHRFSKIDMAQTADAVAVLGAAQYKGKPSPIFQARLDHAFELSKKDFAPIIITTGGIYPGEKISEGEVGKKYLQQKGVPAEKIIAETNSLTTKQSIARLNEIAEKKNLKKIILVSDPFHMYRTKLIAENLGIEVLTSPTRTSPISKNFWLEMKYIAREMALSFLHILFDA